MYKRPGIPGGLAAPDFQVDPACGPVNGNIQIALLILARHPGQMFDVDVQVTRLIIFEERVLGLLILTGIPSRQLCQCRHSTPPEHAVQGRAIQMRIHSLAVHCKAITTVSTRSRTSNTGLDALTTVSMVALVRFSAPLPPGSRALPNWRQLRDFHRTPLRPPASSAGVDSYP